MNKLLKLIHVMRKCGRGKKDSQSTSAYAGNANELLMPVLGVALAVGMFFAGRYLAEHQDTMGSVDSIFSTIMILGCLASFFMTIPQIINQLYMSSDLDVLVTLPFTDVQIVVGKLASVSIMPLLICCGLVIPCGLGFGITAGGFGAMYWVAMVLTAPMLALCMVAMAGILIILLMRCFRFVRSRNLISVISTLLVFVLSIAYISLNQSVNVIEADKIFVMISNSLSGVAHGIPLISLCLQAMTENNVVPLLLALAITVAVMAVLFIVARVFYFSAALGMQDANGSKVQLTDAELRKSTRAAGLRTSLRRREVRTILRTPCMITNGYLYSIVIPFIMVIPMVLKLYDSVKENLAAAGITVQLSDLPTAVQSLHLGWEVWCTAIPVVFLLLGSIAVGFSVLSYGCISREGKNYAVLKAMPIPMETMVMVKRDVAMLFNGISGYFVPVLVVIVAAVMGIMPLWTVAVAMVVGAASLVFLVDLCSYFGLKKPNLNWESEADACKNNWPGLIAFFVILFGFLALFIMASDYDIAGVMSYVAIGSCALPVVLALVFDVLLRKEAGKLTQRI